MSASVSLRPFALFYFSYFAFQGLFSPFWGLYLASLSFPALQISILMALSTLARIVAPGLWGWLADRRGQRRHIVIVTSVLSALAFGLVGLGRDFWWVFATLAVSHFFWAAALPLVEASTAHLTCATPGRYSRVRVWGSIGFVSLSLLGGVLLQLIGLAHLPWLIFALLLLVVLAACFVPEVQTQRRHVQRQPIADTLRRAPVRALFACCFLLAFGMGPYYTFYSIGLQQAGYGNNAIGWLWSVGVVCEIAAFLLMPRLMARFTLEQLMLGSLLATTLRFVLMAALLAQPAVAVFAQMLHALTFAVHHAAAVGLIQRHFAESHQARGQGLYVIASFGIGGSAGGLLGGVLWPLGGVALTFAVSALATALGVLLCLRWLSPPPALQQ